MSVSLSMGEGEVADFSANNLEKVPEDIFVAFPNCIRLILRNNHLQSFQHLNNLTSCIQVDVSHNQICRLVGLNLLKNKLKILDASHNNIITPEGLNQLGQLTWLSLAHNHIEKFPVIERLKCLTFLDLSNNRLVNIPKLSYFKELDTALLANNHIESLEFAPKSLPLSLKILDIGGNRIQDLCQISYLSSLSSLLELTVRENPMTQLGEPGFDYRPYILCFAQSLTSVDGFVVTEKEQLKGEWLYCQGKGRQFKPGQHKQLTEYLSQVCSLAEDSGRLSTELEIQIQRALEKRKEYLSSSTSTPTSHSHRNIPVSNKENRSTVLREKNLPKYGSNYSASSGVRVPIFRRGLSVSSVSSISPRSPTSQKLISDNSNPTVPNPYQAYDNRVAAAAFGNNPTSSTTPLRSEVTVTDVKDAYKSRSSRYSPCKGFQPSHSQSPLSATKSPTKTNRAIMDQSSGGLFATDENSSIALQKRNRAAVKLQAWWRGTYIRGNPSVRQKLLRLENLRKEDWIRHNSSLLQQCTSRQETFEEMNGVMAEILRKLHQDMETLRTENDTLKQTVDGLSKRCSTLENVSTQLVPPPSQIRFESSSPKCGVLSWDLNPTSQFKFGLFVNGEHCGDIRSKRARISDLDETVSHTLEVATMTLDGTVLVKSTPFVVPASSEPSPSKEVVVQQVKREEKGWGVVEEGYFTSSAVDIEQEIVFAASYQEAYLSCRDT